MNYTDDSPDRNPPNAKNWDGNPEELVGWEDEIANSHDLAECLFPTKADAFSLGLELGQRLNLNR